MPFKLLLGCRAIGLSDKRAVTTSLLLKNESNSFENNSSQPAIFSAWPLLFFDVAVREWIIVEKFESAWLVANGQTL